MAKVPKMAPNETPNGPKCPKSAIFSLEVFFRAASVLFRFRWNDTIASQTSIGFPFFSGFYSKELIIHHLQHSTTDLGQFAYKISVISVFITTIYAFRLLFVVFHGKKRTTNHSDIKNLFNRLSRTLVSKYTFSRSFFLQRLCH